MKKASPKSFRGRVISEWKQAGCPKWNSRELLAMCMLVDYDFQIENLNPAPKFRDALQRYKHSYLLTWSQGLKIPFEK